MLIEGVGADATRRNPAGVDGFGDYVRVLRGCGLMSGEGFVEFAIVVGGIFAEDEERFGAAAVGEGVEAGEGVLRE